MRRSSYSPCGNPDDWSADASLDKHIHARGLVLQPVIPACWIAAMLHALRGKTCCWASQSTPHCVQMLVPSDLQRRQWWRWIDGPVSPQSVYKLAYELLLRASLGVYLEAKPAWAWRLKWRNTLRVFRDLEQHLPRIFSRIFFGFPNSTTIKGLDFRKWSLVWVWC